MNLELKHLAPYLPYKVKTKGLTSIYPDPIITGILNSCNKVYWNYHGATGAWKLEDIKPILRPLSDLTKKIEINGKVFIPIIELANIEFNNYSHEDVSNEFIEDEYEVYIEYLPSWFGLYYYKKVNKFCRWDDGEGLSPCSNELLFKLFEWHFDVFGLLDVGLATELKASEENKAITES